jgi:hypothetical protein
MDAEVVRALSLMLSDKMIACQTGVFLINLYITPQRQNQRRALSSVSRALFKTKSMLRKTQQNSRD